MVNDGGIREFRTGCPVLTDLWSYVLVSLIIDIMIIKHYAAAYSHWQETVVTYPSPQMWAIYQHCSAPDAALSLKLATSARALSILPEGEAGMI
jgi:hypothetical protein